jgi:hypothetical protein
MTAKLDQAVASIVTELIAKRVADCAMVEAIREATKGSPGPALVSLEISIRVLACIRQDPNRNARELSALTRIPVTLVRLALVALRRAGNIRYEKTLDPFSRHSKDPERYFFVEQLAAQGRKAQRSSGALIQSGQRGSTRARRSTDVIPAPTVVAGVLAASAEITRRAGEDMATLASIAE